MAKIKTTRPPDGDVESRYQDETEMLAIFSKICLFWFNVRFCTKMANWTRLPEETQTLLRRRRQTKYNAHTFISQLHCDQLAGARLGAYATVFILLTFCEAG